MIARLACAFTLLFLCASCQQKPPDCRAIRDMKQCEQTKGCSVSSIWVVGLPDAKPPPQHHQYECITKQP